MEIKYAPWTVEEVNNINDNQTKGYGHPFTCCSPEEFSNECFRVILKHNDGILKANTESLTCPCGRYKQDWVYPGMLEPLIKPE